MAEGNVKVTEGAGKNIDVFTLASTGNQRQAVVLGDSSVDANVAPVQATDPSSNSQGIVVRDVNTSAIVSKLISGVTVTPSAIGTMAIYFDQSQPTVKAIPSTGTFVVKFDPGYELGSIKGINSSINIYIGSTAGTLIIKPDPAGTFFTNSASTANIFSASGSVSGVSVSGNTIVSPSANASFKVFAINITTTAQTNITVKITNGAGTSPIEYWRYNLWAPTQGIAGANIAVSPPGHFFATGVSTTLALVLDAGSLIHYSFSYIKESA
jgi:hypothetical protein